MRTLFALVCSVMLFGGIHAQTTGYNLFDPNDCDADGWLWFDTQAKIDKYIGQANNTIGAYDPNGKPIQLVSTDYTVKVPDPDGFPGDMIEIPIITRAGTDSIGAAKDAVPETDDKGKTYDTYPIGGPGAIKGAIALTRSTAPGFYNGGALLVKLPPIVSYELYLSSTRYMLVNVKRATTVTERFPQYDLIKGYAVFNKLKKTGGHLKYNIGGEKNANTDAAVKSSVPQCVLLRNGMTAPLYIHGIRIFTAENHSTGLNTIYQNDFAAAYRDGALLCNHDQAAVTLFDLAGKQVARGTGRKVAVPHVAAGVYLLKITAEGKTQVTKVVVRGE